MARMVRGEACWAKSKVVDLRGAGSIRADYAILDYILRRPAAFVTPRG